jgi:Sec-independent protein translocase protein TatA
MTKQFAQSWEYVFSICLPETLETLAESLGKSLRSFRKQMSQRQQLTKASSFALVTRQVRILEKGLKDTTELKAILSTGQRDASRLPIPVITGAMADAYAYCVEESGKNTYVPAADDLRNPDHFTGTGCFKRIKEQFLEHIKSKRAIIFQAAARETEEALRATIDELEAAVDKNVESIVGHINKDYSALLKDENIFKELTAARENVWNLLDQVDGRFERVLRSPVEPTSSHRTEEARAMDDDRETRAASVDTDVPPEASASSLGASPAPGTETPTSTAIDDTVRIKAEPSSTAALNEDVPMWDV